MPVFPLPTDHSRPDATQRPTWDEGAPALLPVERGETLIPAAPEFPRRPFPPSVDSPSLPGHLACKVLLNCSQPLTLRPSAFHALALALRVQKERELRDSTDDDDVSRTKFVVRVLSRTRCIVS